MVAISASYTTERGRINNDEQGMSDLIVDRMAHMLTCVRPSSTQGW
jgi:hypothetical protein